MPVVLRRLRRPRACLGAALLLVGCEVGPDFERPAPPDGHRLHGASRWPGKPHPRRCRGRRGAALCAGSRHPRAMVDPVPFAGLERAGRSGDRRQPDPAGGAGGAAPGLGKRLRRSRASLFPTVTAGFSPSRNKTATGAVTPVAASGNPYYSLYTAQVTVSYTPDVFGGTRRQIESLVASAEAQRFRARSHLSDLDVQRRRRGGAGGIVARADRGDRGNRQNRRLNHWTSCASSWRSARSPAPMWRRVEASLAQAQATAAAAAKAAGGRARPVDRADRTVSEPGTGRKIRPRRTAIAARSAGEPAVEARRAAPRCALRRGRGACRQRRDRRRHRQSAAAIHPDRQPRRHRRSRSAQLFMTPGTAFWTLAGNVTQTVFDAGTLLHKQRAAEAAFDEAAAAVPQHRHRRTAERRRHPARAAIGCRHADGDLRRRARRLRQPRNRAPPIRTWRARLSRRC